jgi:hypothetical protein
MTPSQPLNLADYPTSALPQSSNEGKAKFTVAPAGEYVMRAPESFVFSKAQSSGNLMARIDSTIEGPTNAGGQVRFARVSTTVFDREVDGTVKKASLAGDFVRAVEVANGITPTEFPGVGEDGNAQPQADAIAACAGKTYRARLNWEAEDRKYGTGTKVRGMTKFPPAKDENGNVIAGQYQPYIELAGKTDEKGRPARLWANLYIQSFVTE